MILYLNFKDKVPHIIIDDFPAHNQYLTMCNKFIDKIGITTFMSNSIINNTCHKCNESYYRKIQVYFKDPRVIVSSQDRLYSFVELSKLNLTGPCLKLQMVLDTKRNKLIRKFKKYNKKR